MLGGKKMNAESGQTYSPGLKGVIAGETSIGRVDPEAGLLYRGYDIGDLALHATFEEVAWLLLFGETPDDHQLDYFTNQLAEARALPPALIDLARLMPLGAQPMDMLRTGVSMLAAFDPELNDRSHDANLRKAIRLIAKVSTLITDGWRITKGLQPLRPQASLSHAGNFLYQLNGEVPEPWLAEIFDTVLVLYAEHEFNASTFSARVTASTLADIYAAVTAALATLKGPLHGAANEEAMRMLRDIGAPDRVESWLQERLARKEKIMGFGHRVYKKADARVSIMRELARQLGQRVRQPQWVEICEQMESIMRREKTLCANVDLYAAPVLYLLGIPPELNTSVFACARVAGWCAHVIEQQDHNRLIRPRSLYTGPPPRTFHRQAGKRLKAA
jgi:citrate synthase